MRSWTRQVAVIFCSLIALMAIACRQDNSRNWKPFASKSDYTEFNQMIRQEFARRAVSAEFHEGYVLLHRKNEQPPLQIGLSNLADHCARRPRTEWKTLIGGHFDDVLAAASGASEVGRDDLAFEDVRDRIVPRLWPLEYFPPESNPSTNFVTRTDLPGILTVLVIDFPGAVRTLTRDEAVRWKKEEAELFELALGNLRARYPVEHESVELPEHGITLHQYSSAGPFAASMALLLDSLPGATGEDGSIFAIPTRHHLVACPIDGGSAMSAWNNLQPLALEMRDRGPGPITGNVYWFHEGKYTLLPHRIEGTKLVFEVPEELDSQLAGS